MQLVREEGAQLPEQFSSSAVQLVREQVAQLPERVEGERLAQRGAHDELFGRYQPGQRVPPKDEGEKCGQYVDEGGGDLHASREMKGDEGR